MRSCLRACLLVAAAVAVAFSAGCTGSEVIDNGNSNFVVEVPVINAETRFERRAEMLLSRINLRPNDPDADAALGARPIGVIATANDLISVNLADPGQVDPSELLLSSGSYRISLLQFDNLLLLDTVSQSWDTCEDYFLFQTPVDAQGERKIQFTDADLGDLADFTVPSGAAGRLTIGIDATAFVDAFIASWTCTPPPNPTPIPGTFDRNGFKALAPTYLTIEAGRLSD